MTLRDFLEELGFETRSYSGRGMYCKECLAVTSEDPIGDIQDIAFEIGRDEDMGKPPRVAFDSMGKSYVIYWPTEKYS